MPPAVAGRPRSSLSSHSCQDEYIFHPPLPLPHLALTFLQQTLNLKFGRRAKSTEPSRTEPRLFIAFMIFISRLPAAPVFSVSEIKPNVVYSTDAVVESRFVLALSQF